MGRNPNLDVWVLGKSGGKWLLASGSPQGWSKMGALGFVNPSQPRAVPWNDAKVLAPGPATCFWPLPLVLLSFPLLRSLASLAFWLQTKKCFGGAVHLGWFPNLLLLALEATPCTDALRQLFGPNGCTLSTAGWFKWSVHLTTCFSNSRAGPPRPRCGPGKMIETKPNSSGTHRCSTILTLRGL